MEELIAAGALAGTEVIKTLAKDMASFLKEKVIGYYKDTTNKELVDSGWVFEDYLKRTYDKYSVSKSILYTNRARKLESFYLPMDLTPFSERPYKYDKYGVRVYDPVIIPSKNMRDVLSNDDKIIIVGTGGMGKTMTMKYFCMNAIESAYKIPVFISLRRFNKTESMDELIEQLVYTVMTSLGFNLDYEYFKYSLEGDKYVFLLDGFDEVSVANRQWIVEKIQDFVLKYPENKFIITSRQVEDVLSFEEFKVFSLCPLTHKQSVQFIKKLDFDYDLKKKFISELDRNTYIKYKEFISVPLLLSILFLTYNDNTIIPETLQEFYEKAFDTMLYQHDRLKAGFTRQFQSGLNYVEFRKFFLDFCFRTYFNEEYSFLENRLIDWIYVSLMKLDIKGDPYKVKDDLVQVICMLIKDGKEFTFIHRSFQEYFAVSHVSKCLEEKQCQLCSAYIKLHGYYCFENDSYSGQQNFLNMLYHIEPVRFEHVVLQPIRSKLFKLCQSSQELLVLVSEIFDLGHVYLIDNLDNAICLEWCVIYGIKNQQVSSNEIQVLAGFHALAEENINIQDSLINDIINTNIEEIIRLFSIRLSYTHIAGMWTSSVIGYSAEEVFFNACREMIRFILIEKQRYINLQQVNKSKDQLQDIVDDM